MTMLIVLTMLVALSLLLISSVKEMIHTLVEQYDMMIDEIEHDKADMLLMKEEMSVWVMRVERALMRTPTHTHSSDDDSDVVVVSKPLAVRTHVAPITCDDTHVGMHEVQAQLHLDHVCDSSACMYCVLGEAQEVVRATTDAPVLARTYDTYDMPCGVVRSTRQQAKARGHEWALSGGPKGKPNNSKPKGRGRVADMGCDPMACPIN